MTVDRIWCDPNCNSFYLSFDESPDCTMCENVCCIHELYMQDILRVGAYVCGCVCVCGRMAIFRAKDDGSEDYMH